MNQSQEKGFTLIELMVAVLIFAIIIGGALNLLFSAVRAQRQHLSQSKVFDQTLHLSEYMSRALRQARKELVSRPGNCLTTAGAGFNYELNGSADRVRFLDKNNKCREFLLSSSQLIERISTDNTAANLGSNIAITPLEMQVQSLRFVLQGAGHQDLLQPLVTMHAKINEFEFQISVSQRNFDVQQ